MQSLTNKRILVGVTGSIAAYKAAELIRGLRDAGAEVRVAMTRGASEFITPMTLQALSGHPVHQKLLDTQAEAGMSHIELSRWADCVLVAPASADFIARLAQGRADDLLSAVCLARDVPLALAPAMNRQMWADAATEKNVRTLQQRGVLMFGPAAGEQACGEVGPGRMEEPAELMRRVAEVFETGLLAGKTVLITAGPTREAVDPVRYIGNRSSGKMGYALCAAAVEAGARVILVSGPSTLATPERVERIDVESAEQMLAAVLEHMDGVDIFIGAAAVADYRPRQSERHKIKKDQAHLTLELERTPDILATVKSRRPRVFCVGFAAETANLDAHARRKLEDKGIDMVAANWVGPAAPDTGGGFDSDTNALRLYWADGELDLPVASKDRLARQLVASIAQRYERRPPGRRQHHNIVELRGGTPRKT
ncbi:MAG: bifunctional phosphopantothenoylcysteine decarboxylase/phosphopantothenate--cysteine ligase CoaBC [Pseudomonadota bacterium]|nr:MAG: bifunctional phosphopantothenoylcysteine decarboxylase/phosphopantothenate--cysteine ligase CoaBC [Pseudomonadota bacterium]